jgi:MOSC domain-containing protein YiiM
VAVLQIEPASLVSLNVGKPIAIAHGAKEMISGIYKHASDEAHQLELTGLSGDGQGDLVHHGGPDKAVCAYFAAHYPYWRTQLSTPISYGAFGENFTISEWTEAQLCIGDIIEAGELLLQVSQPRQPCYKLGVRHQMADLPVKVQKTGYTGFYFRVLREGKAQAGMKLRLKQRHHAGITIAEANRLMYVDKQDIKGLQKLLAVKELAQSWQEQLGSRLERLLAAQEGTRQ